MTVVQIDDEGNKLTPGFLRRRGLRRALGCEVGLRAGDLAVEPLGREALGDLVDAFLHDRTANADLFARSHHLGALLSRTVRCGLTPGPEQYTLRCPIFALHQTWATSVAMTITTTCSICGAGHLECDHLPGRTYDGEECTTVVDSIAALGHLAITANPDFVYTWHRPQPVATAQLVADGTIARAGAPAYCTHCQGCAGLGGPSEGDLDPVGRLLAYFEEAQTQGG